MARIAHAATDKVFRLLTAPAGVNSNVDTIAALEQVSLPEIAARQIVAENVSFEFTERSGEVKYPVVHVYCEKLVNLLKEKFRTFSGKAYMVIEVRISQDRLEQLERKLQLYAHAAMQVLDQNRGDWGNGMFFTGGYEVAFGPVKRGGRNFIQIAKINFEVEVSN